MLRNVIVVSEFVIVLKSKKTAFVFFLALIRILNFLLAAKTERKTQALAVVLLKNVLNHLHFEYGRVELGLLAAAGLMKNLLRFLLAAEPTDLEALAQTLPVCMKTALIRTVNF